MAQVWAEPQRAPLCGLRLHLDARLQRAGPDPGAVRRQRVRIYAGRDRRSCPASSTAACFSAWCWSALAAEHERGTALRLAAAWTVAGCVASALALLEPGGRRPGRARLAAAHVGVRARRRQRRLRGRRHRLDDGAWPVPAGSRAKACGWALWGAAQAVAFGLGGFAGTAASDLARCSSTRPASAYALGLRRRGAAVPGRRRSGHSSRQAREPRRAGAFRRSAALPAPGATGG